VARDHGPRLRPADVIYILQSPLSDAALGRALGVSRQSVGNIRNGQAYVNVAPQLPRRKPVSRRYETDGVTCLSCPFWNGHGCAFEFPEALLDLRFAQECSMFALKDEDPIP
jgi:hypothetical protein